MKKIPCKLVLLVSIYPLMFFSLFMVNKFAIENQVNIPPGLLIISLFAKKYDNFTPNLDRSLTNIQRF